LISSIMELSHGDGAYLLTPLQIHQQPVSMYLLHWSLMIVYCKQLIKMGKPLWLKIKYHYLDMSKVKLFFSKLTTTRLYDVVGLVPSSPFVFHLLAT